MYKLEHWTHGPVGCKWGGPLRGAQGHTDTAGTHLHVGVHRGLRRGGPKSVAPVLLGKTCSCRPSLAWSQYRALDFLVWPRVPLPLCLLLPCHLSGSVSAPQSGAVRVVPGQEAKFKQSLIVLPGIAPSCVTSALPHRGPAGWALPFWWQGGPG